MLLSAGRLRVVPASVAAWLFLGGAITPAPRPTVTRDQRQGASSPTAERRTRPQAEEIPAGLSGEEWGQIRGLVEKGRYHAAPVTKAGEPVTLEASNLRQGYITTFAKGGIELASRPVAGLDWRLGVRVTGYGPEGDVRPLPVAEPVAEGERVEYRRGAVTEWYKNGPGGLEQWFTIAEPETRESRPLVLAMAVEGGLAARLEGADEASFHDSSGVVRVRYAGLKAWDADHRTVTSWLEAPEGQLRLLVDAAEARFPVTVDPKFVGEARLTASDGAPNDYFGDSVSVSGDTVVVGADGRDSYAGSAYVFVRSGTVWSEQQQLVPADGAVSAGFTWSVSVSGDTVVVGAPSDETAGGLYAGSAYVFVRSGTVWSQQRKLRAADGAWDDLFGWSVSVSGDTVVVGAPGDDAVGSFKGWAYVFERSGTGWSQQQKLRAPDGAVGDAFGDSVSVSGDTVVVGAPFDDTAAGVGSAYVFVRWRTVWIPRQKLRVWDGTTSAFGLSVSVSGDMVVGGAPFEETAGGPYAGSAYVFVKPGVAGHIDTPPSP